MTSSYTLAPREDLTACNTPTRWDIFIGYLASGVPLEQSVVKARIDSATIETMCRLPGGAERQRFNDARLAGFKTTLSTLAIEEFFLQISNGKLVEEAMELAFGAHRSEIWQLINSDPDMHAQYRRAQESAMYREFDEIKGITDDTSRDIISGPKGDIPNNAAVGRDKLRMDARFKRAGILNRRVFGEERQAAVTVNVNYAQTLEDARARAKDRGQAPRKISRDQMANAIEAISEANTEDTSWMDAVPAETIWREDR